MNANTSNETFDDIVFENRNRTYGAYVIRRNYVRSAIMAAAIGIGILMLLAAIPAISAWINKMTEKKELKTDTKVELATVEKLEESEPPPPPPPPAKVEPPKVEMIKFTEPEVVEEVDDKDIPPITEETPKNIGTENVEGTDEFAMPDPDAGKVVEEVVAPQIFQVVEQMPQFPGGEEALLKYLAKNIKYPEMAKDAGTQGTIYITFVVDENGKITSPSVLRGLSGPGSKDCGNEALRVISNMPSWSAGKQNGKPVKVQYNLPVKFILR